MVGMERTEEMVGRRYGHWTIISFAGLRNGKAGRLWNVECDHGQKRKVRTYNLKSLVGADCAKTRPAPPPSGPRPTGVKHGQSQTRLYKIWKGMKKRCNRPRSTGYYLYGGRNIHVCPQWNDPNGFIAFRDWAVACGYSDTLEIDRIDNDGDYAPDNCRWVTPKASATNRRTSMPVLRFAADQTVVAFWPTTVDAAHALGVEPKVVRQWCLAGDRNVAFAKDRPLA